MQDVVILLKFEIHLSLETYSIEFCVICSKNLATLPLLFKFQTKKSPQNRGDFCLNSMAGVAGIEPAAYGFGDRRSSHLSYTPTVQCLV